MLLFHDALDDLRPHTTQVSVLDISFPLLVQIEFSSYFQTIQSVSTATLRCHNYFKP